MMPVLEKLGVAKKSKFMQKFENGISIEEARKIYLKHIDELWKNNN